MIGTSDKRGLELSRGLWGLNVAHEMASGERVAWCDQSEVGTVMDVMIVRGGDWCGVTGQRAN